MQDESIQSISNLPRVWSHIAADYNFIKIQGQGSFGQVVKATQKSTSKTVAIKYIQDAFDNIHSCKRVFREIAILRRLTQMENNIFTVKLLDVIIPEENESQYPDGIFLVMDYVNQDLGQIFSDNKMLNFEHNHAKTILYNLLCAVNFLHSANVIHRDLKPGNILLTNECSVRICDFGLARSKPLELNAFEKIGNLSDEQ